MSDVKHSLQRQADRARPGKQRLSVLIYLVILFAAALVLLLLSYFMQQRSNEETLDGLKQSVTAMQSAQEAYEENAALKQQLEQMESLEEQVQAQQEELDRLTLQNQTLQQEKDDLELTAQAMDWFWQINEAYVRGRTAQAKELIAEMGSELPQYLPTESATGTERLSPSARYQEICDALS